MMDLHERNVCALCRRRIIWERATSRDGGHTWQGRGWVHVDTKDGRCPVADPPAPQHADDLAEPA